MPEKFTIALCALATFFILATNVHAVTESTAFYISMTAGGYSGDITGTSTVTGVKLGYEVIGQDISDSLGIEAGFSAVSSKSSAGSNTKDLYLYRIDAIYPFMPRKRLVPYLALGVGGCSNCGESSENNTLLGKNNALLGNYGIGAKYFLTENIAFRTDFRQLIISDGGKSNNFEYTAGLTYYFSKDKQFVRIPIADTDKDGVPDDIDVCPNTPRGVKVDATGCPPDNDKDGVPDYLDKCPDTPPGIKVSANGCPIAPPAPIPAETAKEPLSEVAARVIPPEVKPGEPPAAVAATGAAPAAAAAGRPAAAPETGQPSIYTKKDLPIAQETVTARISDAVTAPAPAPQLQPAIVTAPRPQVAKKPDLCPTLPDKDYVAADAAREKTVIEFDSDSAELKRKYFPALKKLRKRLKENNALQVTIEGHADYRGNPAYNLNLSWQRAAAVKSYLIRDRGVAAKRITIKPFGCTMPIDDNRTNKGRQKNRRAVILTIEVSR